MKTRPDYLMLPSALALGVTLVLLLAGCGPQAPAPAVAAEPSVHVFKVEGMHCSGCERSITEAVEALDGLDVLAVSHSNGVLRVESDGRAGPEAVVAAVEPLGYTATVLVQSE